MNGGGSLVVRAILLFLVLPFLAALPRAAVGAQPEVSAVAERTGASRLYGLGVLLPSSDTHPFGQAWLEPHWFGRVAEWSTRDRDVAVRDLRDLQLGRLFRLSAERRPAGRWFAELGISGHVLSHTELDHRRFGTAFQFGEDVGVGFDFGAGNAWSALLRLEHVSNGGMVAHNDGMTFVGLELRAKMR
jgi:hypothetical protein